MKRILYASFAFGLACATVGAQEAGGQLNVSPKNTKTIFRAAGGTTKPGKLRYKIQTTKGKGTWTLTGYKKFFSTPVDTGTVGKRKKTITLEATDAKIDKLKPNIYRKKIKWLFEQGGNTSRVPRNVTVIVEGDAVAGETFFNNTCSGCHSVSLFHDPNKQGPSLGSAYGRKAGTLAGYSYSSALQAYGKTWEEDNLFDWLRNSQKLVKNANMFMILKSAEDRMNVIAYLKSIAP